MTTSTATIPADLETVQGTWTLDPFHTRIGFSAKHAMVTTVRGAFSDFTGSIEVVDDRIAQVSVSIRTGSVATGQEPRDNHLRSGDFFDAEQFPEMTFVSTSIEVDSETEFVLVGDLTVKDVTREVRIEVESSGLQVDHKGNMRAGFEGECTISRKDFGLTWNVALEAGGVLVSDKIKIQLDVSAIKNA